MSVASVPLTDPSVSESLSFVEAGDADILTSLYETPLGEQALMAVNGRVFDKVGSAAIYATTFGDEWYDKKNQLLLIIGSDGGLMLPYIQEKAAGDGRRVLIVDLPEVVDWVEANVPYDHDLIRLLPADGDLSLLDGEDYNSYVYRNAVSIHRSLATLDQFHPAYTRLWNGYEQLLYRFFYNHMVEIHGSSGFINAQLLNLADNRHSMHHLYGRFQGGVAVLLAGGPSLDDAIEWVKENRLRITLFAVGRVCARLSREGITPDFIGAVDPNEISFDNSKHLLEHYQGATFLHAYHVNPRLLAQYRGRAFYHGRRYPWIVKEKDASEQYTAPGPTVTNTLISFMTHMGFETIIFAGVDMCHRIDGQTHESGSIESQVGRFVHKAAQFVTTNSGLMAPTSTDLYTAHQVLEVQVRSILLHFPAIRFFNPSPDSARVESVTHVPWSELTLPEWENRASEVVDDILDTLRFKESDFLVASRKEVARMRGKLAKVQHEAHRGMKAARVLFDDSAAIPRRTAQVNAARDGIERQLKDNLPLLIDYAPAAFHDALAVDTRGEQSQTEIQQALTHYFKAVDKASGQLLETLDHALEIIALRGEESRYDALTESLVKGWMRYGQPGRLYVWLDRHQRPLDSLTPAELSMAYPVIRAYEAIFKVAETGIERKFKASVYDNTLESVLKAMREVSEDNIQKLDEVLSYCEDHAQEAQGFYRDLGLFILGYFNRLRGELPAAYDAWRLVSHERLVTHVYNQHLTLALTSQDFQEALGVLERLCLINRSFLTVYANLLQSLNQPQLACEVLGAYLKEAPRDMAARLQLARLYLAQQQGEQAYPLLEEAYQQSPTNPIVQKLFVQVGGRIADDFRVEL